MTTRTERKSIMDKSPDVLTDLTRSRLKDAHKISGRQRPSLSSVQIDNQNYVISGETMRKIVDRIDPDSHVVEIGTGVGILTEALAERNQRVFGIEIDTAFHPVLANIHTKLPQINFAIGDALQALNFTRVKKEEKIQIVSNLPFSITKKFMAKLAGTQIDSAVFFLGKDYAQEAHERDTTSDNYGHLSLIAQTFFKTEKIADIDEGSFYPDPKTTGEVIVMQPKTPETDTATRIFCQIIKDTQPPPGDTEFNPPSVLTSISQVLSHPEDVLLEWLSGITSQAGNIPHGQKISDVLHKPFFALEKNEVGVLVNFVQQQFTLAS